jgi:hypothetical protein
MSVRKNAQKHTGPGFKKCRIIKNLSKCWYIENDGEKQDINLLPSPSNKIIKIPDIGPDPDQSHAEPRVYRFRKCWFLKKIKMLVY